MRLYEGLRVVEFTTNIAGPTIGRWLAEYGADVIHVERPVYGDDSRGYPPMFDGVSAQYHTLNHSKKSLVLDLKDPEGLKIAKELCKTADIVLESNRPGAMDRLGLGYEALRDLPLEDVQVETPIETCMTPMIAGRKLAVVPILRAGLGMVSGILALVPSAKVGHIGLYRDEVTHEPHEYYCKLPSPIEERTIIVTDPMLATGGSAVTAVDFIKQHGGRKIKFMSIIAAPEGLERLHKAHPDVQIYVGHLDRCLNENAYICPGLGDAGDRIFGTK